MWKTPHAFKADRFMTTLSRVDGRALSCKDGEAEPLPTLGFGHPLGSINDLATINETHACVFTRLAQPVVKAYARAGPRLPNSCRGCCETFPSIWMPNAPNMSAATETTRCP